MAAKKKKIWKKSHLSKRQVSIAIFEYLEKRGRTLNKKNGIQLSPWNAWFQEKDTSKEDKWLKDFERRCRDLEKHLIH